VLRFVFCFEAREKKKKAGKTTNQLQPSPEVFAFL
jgi:hypothetical protein